MSRSTLIFSLVAELLVGSAAFAKATPEERAARCLANCETLKKKFEKSCKAQMPGGKCDGRGKALVDDMDKQCREGCAKKQRKSQ